MNAPNAESAGASRWILLAVLVVVLGGVVMWIVTRPARTPEVRTAAGIRALTGEGVLDGPDGRFSWSRDARADVYRLEVYDLSSKLLAAAVTRDTTIPASAVLPDSSHSGIWRVVPVSRGGTELPPTANARFTRK